jgi:hypothetical protein
MTVTRSRVKERCAISDTSYDTTIDNLIADLVPAIEFSVDPLLVASSDTGLQATLNLAALELVCGEFLALRLREPGAAEGITMGTFELRPPTRDLTDPSGLKAQGAARLLPYLKPNPSLRLASGVTS